MQSTNVYKDRSFDTYVVVLTAHRLLINMLFQSVAWQVYSKKNHLKTAKNSSIDDSSYVNGDCIVYSLLIVYSTV